MMIRGSLCAFAIMWVACVPYFNPKESEIPKIASVKELMHAQATIADPQWSRIGDSSYSDVDYEQFKDVSVRIQATALRSKSFGQGTKFDEYADKLAAAAKNLGVAATEKNAVLASSALEEMKKTCKACHSELR